MTVITTKVAAVAAAREFPEVVDAMVEEGEPFRPVLVVRLRDGVDRDGIRRRIAETFTRRAMLGIVWSVSVVGEGGPYR